MTAEKSSSELPASPSTFVTVVAWAFIVLGGFAAFAFLMQGLMVSFVLPTEELRALGEGTGKSRSLSAFGRLFAQYPKLFIAASFGMATLTFVSAIGLLKRRNWARLLMIGLLGIGIAWNLGSVLAVFGLFSPLSPLPDSMPADMRQNFERAARLAFVYGAVVSVAIAVLFGWIIKRLVSPKIKREFVSA
jgi:hypothetical protein